ncbi:MAG TPA: Rossmann-like and DUF2520 domain-containing protein [Gemmatimonadales bacterium]|nr:Rossmann-like and DUF2520 domain-containing protein [Gemmatimonadales bacterium]
MITIVGGGRMGRGLAGALSGAGERVTLWSRREASGAVDEAVSGASTVVLAVPDDAIGALASALAAAGAVNAGQVVLHLSGLHGREALDALARSGAALGSMHPLQTVSDPATAVERWRGAYAAVEGDPRAIEEGERLARLLGLTPFRLESHQKAAYHAGAVMVGNYAVALAGAAARLASSAGRMYLPLLAGALENLGRQSTASALTGPVRRGDLNTIRAHLEALYGDDRMLYAVLGLEAVRLAREAGLEAMRADEVERVLRTAIDEASLG